MNTKRILVIAGSISLIGVILIYSVTWSATAPVNATVMVQNIALSVGDGTVAYGTMIQNSTRSTCSTELNDLQTVTNTGNTPQTFNIRGQDSANWTLAATAGNNQYVHRFLNATCTTFTGGTVLTTAYQTLQTNVAPAGTANLNLQINTPNPSTAFAQQNVNVLLQAVAF